MNTEQPKRTPQQIIGDDALTQLIFEGYEVMPARRSSDEQAEVVGDEAMLAAVGAISELEDAILACQTLDDLAGLQAAAQRRREADLTTFNHGVALAQARLSSRDEPISPELQAVIDHTKAKIRAAFSGVTPSPAVAAGGVTEEALREALRFISNIDNAHPVVRKLRAALAVGDEGIREGWQPVTDDVRGPVTVCRFSDADHNWLPMTAYRVSGGKWERPASRDGLPYDPTHWQPLPVAVTALSTPPSRGEGV